jgi:hypothetical protein
MLVHCFELNRVEGTLMMTHLHLYRQILQQTPQTNPNQDAIHKNTGCKARHRKQVSSSGKRSKLKMTDGIVKLVGQLWWTWVIELWNTVQYRTCCLLCCMRRPPNHPELTQTNSLTVVVTNHLIYGQLPSYRGKKTKIRGESVEAKAGSARWGWSRWHPQDKHRISPVKLTRPHHHERRDQTNKADPGIQRVSRIHN